MATPRPDPRGPQVRRKLHEPRRTGAPWVVIICAGPGRRRLGFCGQSSPHPVPASKAGLLHVNDDRALRDLRGRDARARGVLRDPASRLFYALINASLVLAYGYREPTIAAAGESVAHKTSN
jgi:hypothetical protein